MGHTGKAIAVGTLYFIFLVALPLGFVTMVSSYIVRGGGDPSRYFHDTSLYILIFGMGTMIFASVGAYYDKGSGKRLVFALTSAVFLALWGYFFIKSMNIYYEGDTYAYEVFVPGIAAVLAISLSFKAIYRIVEYHVYRKEYLGAYTEPPAEYHSQGEYAESSDEYPENTEYSPEYQKESDEEMYF